MKVQCATIRTGKQWPYPFAVEYRATENWSAHAACDNEREAEKLADALAERYPRMPVRVAHYMYVEGAPIR